MSNKVITAIGACILITSLLIMSFSFTLLIPTVMQQIYQLIMFGIGVITFALSMVVIAISDRVAS